MPTVVATVAGVTLEKVGVPTVDLVTTVAGAGVPAVVVEIVGVGTADAVLTVVAGTVETTVAL